MAFFQQSVLDKYLRALDSEKLQASFDEFKKTFQNPVIQDNIRQSKEEQYQRGFLRDLFVNVLGYRLNPQENFNLTTEYKNVKDSKKADGAILINEQVKAVIELKGTDTTDLNKVEEQAFGYKNNQPDCTYVIISNFEKLRFYIDNAIEHIEFNLFSLTENEFALLWLCLAYENIASDLPKKIKTASVSQEDEITQKLYKDYSQFKQELFRNIVKQNPEHNELELFKKSQKLLDRFLFVFFAEDRNLLPPNSMRKILHQWKQLQELDAYTPLYNRFKKYFGYMNTGFKGKTDDVFAYNGGLFKPDAILDAIVIDDAVLYEHTLNLSNYDYASEVDVNILGHIFEHSLNEIEEVKANLEGKEIDKTQTKRKKDGIYYTPKYITKYIVENTVGKLCDAKKQELGIVEEEYLAERKRNILTKKPLLEKLEAYRDWLLKLTICDPACGSGAFLNQALDFLIKEHHYIDELIAKITGASIVFEDVEISILENNLFGVDLNEESVEIAKLSLWLRTARPQRKLNDLNNNIKCGNSLIDDPKVAGDKAFNWEAEFPHVFADGGFDVVIGNPPYVDIKNLPPIDVKYYFQKYSTTENRINLYSIFIEKGLSILNDKGKLSYINPNSMLINSSYFKLRKLLFSNLSKIIKLPDDVFAAAKVETIIFELDKNYKDDIVNVIVYKKDEVITEIDDNRIVEFYKSDWIKNENLNFNIYSNPKTTAILNKIESSESKLLGDIADFTLGITPYDKYKGHSAELIKNREFHSETKVNELYKPLIKGENIQRYFTDNRVKEYIKYGDWLGAKREEAFFTQPRILIRQIVSGTPPRIYASFTDEALYFTQIGFGVISKDNSTFDNKYLLTILNSLLMNYYHKYKFLDIEKELFQKILIANCKCFPIKDISLENQQAFIEKADQMLSLNKELQEVSQKFIRMMERRFEIDQIPNRLQEWYTLSYDEFLKELSKKKIKLSLAQEAEWEDYFQTEKEKATAISEQIAATDHDIDQMVYKLYNLTDEEIEIVEKG